MTITECAYCGSDVEASFAGDEEFCIVCDAITTTVESSSFIVDEEEVL